MEGWLYQKIEKKKEDKRSNSGNHSRSKIRGETRNIDTKRDKNKITETILLNFTKTKAQGMTPIIIVKNTIKRKETFFQKIGQLQKIFRSS